MSGPPRPLLRAELFRIAQRHSVPVDIVEKDYVLSYLLAGIADVPGLHTLRFKGGTALKKMYFGDYRFSEYLDFSSVDVPNSGDLEPLIDASVRSAQRRLSSRGRFQISLSRHPEHGPHPTGQDAFRVLAAFPWQRSPMVRVKIEVTHDEPVLLLAPDRALHHGYEELGEHLDDVRLATYALEEIVAEKLRALLQTQLRLALRGWNRPRARDYYDLWRILAGRGQDLDPLLVRRILPEKLAARGVRYSSVDDFFTPDLRSEARRHWRTNLAMFVPALPEVDTVLGELHPLIATLLQGSGIKPPL